MSGAGRRRSLILGAAVVAALLVTAIVLSFGRGREDRSAPDATAAGSTPTPATLSPPRSTAEGGLRWVEVQGVKLPVSAAAGPGRVEDNRSSGFARTEAGAALAAVHILATSSPSVGPRTYGATIAEQVTGSTTAALRATTDMQYNRERAELGVADGQPLGRGFAEFVGYRIDAFDPAQPVGVRVLVRGPARAGQARYVDFRTQVVWQDGDWKLVAPPAGDWSTVATPIATPQGYTLFPTPPGG